MKPDVGYSPVCSRLFTKLAPWEKIKQNLGEAGNSHWELTPSHAAPKTQTPRPPEIPPPSRSAGPSCEASRSPRTLNGTAGANAHPFATHPPNPCPATSLSPQDEERERAGVPDSLDCNQERIIFKVFNIPAPRQAKPPPKHRTRGHQNTRISSGRSRL